MSVSNYIATRYLLSSRENRYFSWITILSVSGIAIGVAALIVVLSVINGFQFELRNRFLQANAHIMAYRYPAGMVNPEKWAGVIEHDFADVVVGTSPFIHYETMLKKGALMQGVLVRGISPRERERVQSMKGLVNPYDALAKLQNEVDRAAAHKPLPDPPSVIIGSGLLGIIDAKVGDTIQLVAPTKDQQTELKTFRIIGEYRSGLKHYDNRLVVTSLPAAQQLFKMDDVVTGLEIGLKDADTSVETTRRMQDRYSLTFREWQSFNKPLLDAIATERNVIMLIVGMVVFVAGFNILTTIFVAVSQKQRDISVLKALGARNGQIVQLFVNQGIYIGIAGAGSGIVLAFLISQLLERYQFIDLPDPYFLTHLPVHYSASVYAGVALAAVAICVLAGLYPALVAARVNITEGLRGTGNAL